MIKVIIKKTNNVVDTLEIKGHALFDTLGKDIVCASASTMLITSVNMILEFDKNSIKYINKNGFYLENIKKDDITNKILDNLVNMFKELQECYKKNIKILEE